MPAIYKVSFEKVADVSQEEADAIEELSDFPDDPAQERFITEDVFEEEDYPELVKVLGKDVRSKLRKLAENGDTFVIVYY
ncbi:MAG: hypothetical protein ACK4WF_03310 [Candidatus Brocadiales bacterium]